jgi:LysM repeat protein
MLELCKEKIILRKFNEEIVAKRNSRYVKHIITKTDTLMGIALKYNMTVRIFK